MALVRNQWCCRRAEFDVGENHFGIGMLSLNFRRDAAVNGTRSSLATCLLSIGWVNRVQPQHVGLMVSPEWHDEDNTLLESLIDGIKATLDPSNSFRPA